MSSFENEFFLDPRTAPYAVESFASREDEQRKLEVEERRLHRLGQGTLFGLVRVGDEVKVEFREG